MKPYSVRLIYGVFFFEGLRVEDGCPSSGTQLDGANKQKLFQACVRCCTNDGNTCNTPMECNIQGNWMSYDEAALKCAESGKRLCRKEELLNNVCCGTGGGGDNHLVWALYSNGMIIRSTRFLWMYILN